MSIEFIFRILGMLVFGAGGLFLGRELVLSGGVSLNDGVVAILVTTLLGGLVGFVITPFLTTRPFNSLQRRLKQVPNNPR